MTAKGRAGLARALAAMEPPTMAAFAGWSAAELEQLFAGLDRLKRHLDADR
jgi:DNA-binding MarR family transcriptional regulator